MPAVRPSHFLRAAWSSEAVHTATKAMDNQAALYRNIAVEVRAYTRQPNAYPNWLGQNDAFSLALSSASMQRAPSCCFKW